MKKVITLGEALLLESQQEIIIYNTHSTPILNAQPQWAENWEALRKKYRKIPLFKLFDFVDFDYLIEQKFESNLDPLSTTWVYMYAKRMVDKAKLDEGNSRGRYVYILTNEAYPGVCKIGKAISPSRRIKQINGAGVVSEWELKYSLSVVDDYKVEALIHKELEVLRMDSFQGSSREFFEIEFLEAVKIVEELALDFRTGHSSIFY